MEHDPMNHPAANLESLMAASRATVREAQGEYVPLERFTEIAVTQPSVAKGYTPDANIAEAIKLFLGHL